MFSQEKQLGYVVGVGFVVVWFWFGFVLVWFGFNGKVSTVMPAQSTPLSLNCYREKCR